MGGQTGSQVSLQVHASFNKKQNKTKQNKTKQKTHTHFKSTGLVPRGKNVTISVAILKSALINRLLYQRMDVSQLGLTPNGKKLTLTWKLI